MVPRKRIAVAVNVMEIGWALCVTNVELSAVMESQITLALVAYVKISGLGQNAISVPWKCFAATARSHPNRAIPAFAHQGLLGKAASVMFVAWCASMVWQRRIAEVANVLATGEEHGVTNASSDASMGLLILCAQNAPARVDGVVLHATSVH